MTDEQVEIAKQMRRDGAPYATIGEALDLAGQFDNNLVIRCKIALNSSRHSAEKHGYAVCSATVDELMEAFDGHCACCGKPESELSRRLATDHNHVTGEFNDWLCHPCHVGTAWATTEKILAYLHRRHFM
jgi:hypothetical protein